MKIITWNVQWCRGVDGRVDPARIVAHAKALADFDVLCLQEIASNFPDPRLAGSRGENQFAEIAQQLPDFTAVPGAIVDVPGEPGQRRHFGNLILSRLPVGQVFRHLLPFPVDAGQRGMPRIALEAVVRAPFGGVRIITTHLEYYGTLKRTAQVEALRAIYAEGSGHARLGQVVETDGGPFHDYPRPVATIITGDFNLEPDDSLHARMTAPFDDDTPQLSDAWETAHPGIAHPATFKIYEKESRDEPEQHCDFIFVSADLVPRLRSIRIDQETQASDHQPVLAEFD
ncbi:MAG TPA: endonuclease/exonuclease/phosphatase family protein [Casimicrobiaceae bacterium]|jgi:endonuclease/exonuclease/phosphatase family metal-dependent hydrolase|nr:endonuclease/exonuclease/phosphatase family protein [Casimicrobiaceae bacterium]